MHALRIFSIIFPLLVAPSAWALNPQKSCRSTLTFGPKTFEVLDSPLLLTPKEVQASIAALTPPLSPYYQTTISSNSLQGQHILPSFDNKALPPSVQKKMQEFGQAMIRYYEGRKGKPPALLRITLRVTSDSVGVRVTKERFGRDGLHTHSDGVGSTSDTIDFVLALQGPGSLVKTKNGIIQIETNQLLLLGDRVRHGSPSSHEPRLIIVGSMQQ